MTSSENSDENDDYDLLITRASKYNRETEATALADVGNVKPTRVTVRGKNFFLCEEHGKKDSKNSNWKWLPSNADCTSCIMYETRDSLPNGLLPKWKEVLEYLITMRSNNNGMQVNNIRLCATDLALHWIFCTVYLHTIAAIEHAISKLDESYKVLKKSASKKSISASHWAKYSLFLQQQKNLFDIKESKEQ